MKKVLSVLAVCFVLMAMTACGSSGENEKSSGSSSKGDSSLLEQLKKKGEVTVGFANEKPYAYKENGKLKGEAVAIAGQVFKNMGINKMNAKLADFGQLIPGLKAGKFDVVTAGMAITPERCKQVDFGEPEIQYGEGLVVKKGNPKNLHSYEDIANSGATVSIMSGATENNFVKDAGVKDNQIKSASDIPATIQAVQSGRADATTGTEMTVKMAFKSAGSDKIEFVNDFKQPDVKGVPSYGAAAFRKDNDELRKAYNKELRKLKENNQILDLIKPFLFSKNNIVDNDLKTEDVCSGKKY